MAQYVYTMKDPIVQGGAAVLRQRAMPVLKKDFGSTKLKSIITKMKKALDAEEYGVAIAAPQIGESLRVFVIAEKVFKETVQEVAAKEKVLMNKPLVFINPVLTRLSRKKREMSEGCLSVRGRYGAVLRHEKATITAQDIHGIPFTYHGSGLLAHIFQHEVDHLEGILYIDKATKLADEHSSTSHTTTHE